MTSALRTLSDSLCPWLEPALQQFESARRLGHLGHAWLIVGEAGIGKLNLALVLAQRLFGASAPPTVLSADAALAALAERHSPMDRHPDLHWLYPEEDKESISIDQVRDMTQALTLTAHRGTAKVALVEPAEAMTTPAANALLKTLEEPSAGTYLLLLSHRPGQLPATIRSRCQHLKLHPPPGETLAHWLDVPLATVVEAQRAVGSSPLRIAALVRDDSYLFFNALERDLTAVCEDKADPLALAQTWAKENTERILAWLSRRLHEELRSRLAGAGVPTEVTVRENATLHNAWRALPARTLFEQYDQAEKLRNQLASGVNVELALQALLHAFLMNRERS